jgi:hypothetical protein
MTEQTPYMDGNAAAGEIGALLSIDVTMARGQCVACGTAGTLASARMYGPAPGLVLRCPACEAVLVRVVEGVGRAWLDLRGLAYLEVPAAG